MPVRTVSSIGDLKLLPELQTGPRRISVVWSLRNSRSGTMKVTVTLGKPIPPPKPKKEQKVKLELDELEATRLYALASYITEDNKDEIERAWRIRLDDIDMTICNALGAAGFQYDEGKIS